MDKLFEKRQDYMSTEYVGRHLDLERVIGRVKEFLGYPHFVPGTHVLWNAMAVKNTDLSFGDMQEFGNFILDNRDRRGSGCSVFVTDDDLVFGLFRTREMLNSQNYDYDYQVFRDLAAATKWVVGDS